MISMSTKSVSFKVILGLTTACGAIAAMYLWLADPLNLKSLSDQELISIFSAHPAAFEQLRQMATEDMQRESYFSESNLDSTLDTKRRQTYKSLLSDLSGPCCDNRPRQDREVYFCWWRVICDRTRMAKGNRI